MKLKQKNEWQHCRGNSSTLVLGTVVTVGILTAALYNSDTRKSIKEVLNPVVEQFQETEPNGELPGHPEHVSPATTLNKNDVSAHEQSPKTVKDGAPTEVDTPAVEDPHPAFKDPIPWLEQALVNLDKKEARLKPRQFKLKLITNKFSRKRTQAVSEEESWADLLGELKDAYRSGEQSGMFPVMFHDYSIEEDELKQKIVQAHQLVIEQGKLRATFGRQVNRSKALGSKVGKVLDEIAHARRIVSIKLDVARTEKELEGLGDVREEVGTILDTAEALVEQADHLSLFELRENAKPRGYTNEEFARIMEAK